MTEKESRKGSKEFVNLFMQSVEEAESESPKAIREALEEIGVDPDQLVSRTRALLADARKRRELAEAREELETVRSVLKEAGGSFSKLKERLRDLSAESSLSVAFYRKLESLEEKDIESFEEDEALLAWLTSRNEEDES